MPFVADFGAFCSRLLCLRSVAVVRLGLIGVAWRRPVVLTIVRNDLRRLFRRSLVLVFSLRKCSRRSNAQQRYDHELSYEPNHFRLFSSCNFSRCKGEREMRRPKGSNTGANVFWGKSLTITPKIRTLSHLRARYRIAIEDPFSHKEAQRIQLLMLSRSL